MMKPPPDRRSIAVLVPTWRRPDSLGRLLDALSRQALAPDRVVVAVKMGDDPTRTVAESAGLGAVIEVVAAPASANLVGQMNAGLAATTEDLVALTDDDAEPRPGWLAGLAAWFDDPSVVATGGLDVQPQSDGRRADVGRVGWFGRVTGNHHLGIGPARPVDLLKGVNLCARGPALREVGFDPRLRGRGNVSHWELALCLALARAGGRLIYDPSVVVDHHVGPRRDGDVNARGGYERASYVDAVHNEALALLEHLPPARRAAYRLWSLAVGTAAVPGLAQVGRRWVVFGEPLGRAWDRFLAAREGVRLASATATG